MSCTLRRDLGWVAFWTGRCTMAAEARAFAAIGDGRRLQSVEGNAESSVWKAAVIKL